MTSSSHSWAALKTKTLRSFLVFAGAAFALLVTPTASAHVLQPVGTTVVQDLGPYQLAATLMVPNTLPATISVQVVPGQPFPGVVAITLWLVPAGSPLPAPPPVHVISAHGTVVAEFPVTQPGDYELGLQVSGQDGGGEARVPVTIVQQPLSWVVDVIPAALGLFVLILGGAMSLRITMHRRRLPVSARTPTLLTSSMAACAVVALVAFVATQFMPVSAANLLHP